METIPRNPILHSGKEVDVYRNLHKGCFSVRDRKTRKVIAHVDSIYLSGVTFHVSEPGRQRVLAEKRKNVHAYVRGRVALSKDRPVVEQVDIAYNPYAHGYFYDFRGKKVHGAKFASLHGGKIHGYRVDRD